MRDAALEKLMRSVRQNDGWSWEAYRRKWIASVRIDPVSGCWMWQGITVKPASGGTYPAFWLPLEVLGVKQGPRAAFTAMLLLWHLDEQYAQLNRGRRFRKCGNTLCVRPSCVTVVLPKEQRTTKIDPEIIKGLRDEGLTLTEIAVRVNMSRSGITKILRRYGYIRRTPTVNMLDLYLMWKNGFTVAKAVEKSGLHRGTVHRWFAEFKEGFVPDEFKVATQGVRQWGNEKSAPFRMYELFARSSGKPQRPPDLQPRTWQRWMAKFRDGHIPEGFYGEDGISVYGEPRPPRTYEDAAILLKAGIRVQPWGVSQQLWSKWRLRYGAGHGESDERTIPNG
jgi:transcriptional regulator with XRE-family HTH domain